MKKLVRTSLVNTPNRRGIKDLNIQFYSHDKNNAGFEFVIKNETDLSEYTAKVLFHFVLSDSTWESAGTIEGNVVKATFNTDLIARCEEVLGFLFLDSESNSLDVFKFKFNVVLSEIDKNEVEKRKIKHVADIEALELVTRSELRDELAKLQVTGGIDLSGYLTTNAANETFATKQELGTYATKDELPSISGLVTTEQLTTAKNSIVEEINNKGYVTSTVAEETYAKKSDLPAPYNDSALVQKIGQLEARVDNDTVYDDTPLKERLTVLESKAIAGGAYDDTHLRERLDTLESKQDKDTVYDDAPLKQRVEALETKVDKDTVYNDEEVKRRLTELENKPAVDTSHFITTETLESKGFLTTHQDISNLATKEELAKAVTKEELEEKHYVTSEQISSTYATKSEIPQPYSDTELVKRITILENRQDNDTVYDDAELKRRVTALEEKPSVDTSNFVTTAVLESKGYLTTHQDISNLVTKEELHEATEIDYSNIVTTDELEPYAKKSELPAPYNDSALVSRVSALENKQDKDTVYDDTRVKERLTVLESKPTVDTSNFLTKSELNTLRPLPTLSINNNTLSIAGGNSVALPSNKPLTGSGTPEGKVIANPGDTYVNSNVSLGDYYYYKERNPGRNTGWKVLYGSMGVNINLTTGGRIRFSRENYFVNASISDLTISLDVLKRGDRRDFYQEGENVVIRLISTKQFDVRESIIPQGYRPIGNFLVPAYSRSGDSIGLFKFEQLYGVVKLILNDITLQNVTSEMLKGINSGLIVYPTQEAWMTKLP